MALATQTINLDLRPHYNKQGNNIVYCSQYDNDLRNVVVNIADAGTAVNVSTYTIYIEGTKPDKKGFSYELTDIGGTVSNNVVTFPLQLQMTACAGITNAELVFYSGDDRVGSSNFILAVEKAGLADDIDVSETDIPAYVDGAQQAAAAAAQSADDAEDAKDLAVSAAETAQGVLESIPEDYSDLSDSVEDVENALQYNQLANAFDGELYDGYWSSTGVRTAYLSDVCNAVKINATAGDHIIIEGKPTISDVAYFISYYDTSGTTRIRRDTGIGTNYNGEAPTGTAFVCFTFEKAELTKDSFNSVSVYINNSIDELKTDTDVIKKVIAQEQTSFIECESGSFLEESGAKVDKKQRIRNIIPICVKGYSSITIPAGYSAWFYRYDKNGDFISYANGWRSGEVNLLDVLTSNTKYINISIKNDATPGSDISAEISTVENGLILSTETTAERSIKNSFVETQINNARHATNPLTLLHFSDLHADSAALNRIMSDADYFNALVDDAICTGDIVADTSAQISSWWNSKVMTCIGNHDTASYSNGAYNWTALSMADRDAYYIAPFESNWGITHTSGKSYYYKDYTTQKVRLIVMDAMLYSSYESDTSLATTQTAWLANLLSDAITNNLHVLIAIHAPHGGAVAEECSFSRYAQGTMPTYNDCNTPQTVIDTVATAIGNGLKFIGYIVGHTHQDNVWDAEGDGKQLMYCVTCAAVAQEAQWKNSDQHRSASEDAYNLVTIDTANTLIKIVRGGGADIDDHMRTRKAICFNYSTGEKVGEVL